MKKAFLGITFILLSAWVVACGNKDGGGGNNGYVATNGSCPAGQVLAITPGAGQTQGCAPVCPFNPALASVNGGTCNATAIQNTTQCTVAGQVPTMQGCLQQCPGNPQMAMAPGSGICNIPVTYSNTYSPGMYGGYNGGFGGGYIGGYTGSYQTSSMYPPYMGLSSGYCWAPLGSGGFYQYWYAPMGCMGMGYPL